MEEGESALAGLAREVNEETGIIVRDWSGPLYSVETAAPDMGWDLRVEVYRALDWHGELATQAALARFIDEGLLARHIRTVTREYASRYDRIVEGLERTGHLEIGELCTEVIASRGDGLHQATSSVSASASCRCQ